MLEVTEDQPRVLIRAQSPLTLPVTINGTMEVGKPFSGQGGSGTHTWTLVMEPYQPIPPVSTP